jgi:N-acetylglutamate synthase-like GNAT family acetyltransferase
MVDVLIREANREDASAIVNVHNQAVHLTAATHYEREILDQWSAVVTAERIEKFKSDFDLGKEMFLVAETNNQLIGFGAITPKTRELNAVYVAPEFVGKGIGAALIKALEELAISLGITELWLDSSLNAEKFYSSHGYIVDHRGEHTLKSGLKMPCIKMHKCLEKK